MTGPADASEVPAPDPPERTAFPFVPDHQLLRLIGSGASGQVWLARDIQGVYRAVKIVYEKTFRHRRPFDREFSGVQRITPISRLHDGLLDIVQVGRDDPA